MNENLIIIPAHNEERHLGNVLSELSSALPAADIAVIDDGSDDDTSGIARSSGAPVLVHPFRMGYGAALQTGYKYALERGYRSIVQMDADGQHDVSSVEKLFEALDNDGVDLVLGSRFLGGDSYKMPVVRRLGSRFFSLLATVLMGRRITDATSGFQALSRKAMKFATADHFPVDFPDADALIMMHHAKLRFKEIPVKMHPNPGGAHMHEGMGAVYYILRMLVSLFALFYIKILYKKGFEHAP